MTYVIYICGETMLSPKYKGLQIIPSRSAMKEMVDIGMDLWDIFDVLNSGYDSSTSKRKDGILERCKDKGNKTTKVVVARSHNWALDNDVWVVTHVSKYTRRR
jgi:hypothetical protein